MTVITTTVTLSLPPRRIRSVPPNLGRKVSMQLLHTNLREKSQSLSQTIILLRILSASSPIYKEYGKGGIITDNTYIKLGFKPTHDTTKRVKYEV